MQTVNQVTQQELLVRITQRFRACRLEAVDTVPPLLAHVTTEITHTYYVSANQTRFALHLARDNICRCTCRPLRGVDFSREEVLYADPIVYRLRGEVHTDGE